MLEDQAIRRAAGVIMWKLTHKDHKLQRVMTEEEASAFAHNREPELTLRELGEALKWAKCAIEFPNACRVANNTLTLHEIRDRLGMPKGAKRGY